MMYLFGGSPRMTREVKPRTQPQLLVLSPWHSCLNAFFFLQGLYEYLIPSTNTALLQTLSQEL